MNNYYEINDLFEKNNTYELDYPYDINDTFQEFGFSKQEIIVIYFIKEGLQYKEIAYEMEISPHTVETYRKRIFKKCGISNKIELLNLLQ